MLGIDVQTVSESGCVSRTTEEFSHTTDAGPHSRLTESDSPGMGLRDVRFPKALELIPV